MKKVALKVAYIGTNFYGFQRQPNLRTIEGELIYVLKKLNIIDDLNTAKFGIAGRTDRGVHSLGNVISFMSEKEILINQINHELSDDIKIIAKAPVRYGFKPRYAEERHYRYLLFEENLDIKSMKELSKLFIGEHDFTNFSKRDQKTPIRKINEIEINSEINSEISSEINSGINYKIKSGINSEISSSKLENSYSSVNYSPVFVDFYGESFLWNMIRKIMRIFLLVGKGKLEIAEVEKYLNPENKISIKTLAPENLILMDTKYKNIKFKYDDYACEGFRRTLIDNLIDYKLKSSIETHMLNIMKNIKE